MNTDLEQLKEIVAGPDWDDDSREYIVKLEEQFEQAVKDSKLLTIPNVVDYVTYLEEDIKESKEMLSEKTMELTERQRIQLHERIRAQRKFLDYFKPENRVEKTIKQHLDVFTGKKDIQQP